MMPHQCPVCFGRGTVPNGFYSQLASGVQEVTTSGIVPEQCRSCGGSGVVWPPDTGAFDPSAWPVFQRNPTPPWPAIM